MAARNILEDLEAIAAWPWLAELAQELEKHDRTIRQLRSGHLGLALFLAARWVTGSGASLTSFLKHAGTWPRLRLIAVQAGVGLPAQPPTYNQFRAFRDRVEAAGRFPALLEGVKAWQTRAGVAQAQGQGLLAKVAPDWNHLARGNVLAADGSVFKPASGVREDADGNTVGSRADASNPRGTGPRKVEQRPGKRGDGLGVPVEMVTVRRDERHTRVVVAVQEILDGNETAAAHHSLGRVAAAADGGVHAVVYDRLLAGADMSRLMDLQVLPVVAMKMPADDVPSLPVPVGAQRKNPAGKKGGSKYKVLARSLPGAKHEGGPAGMCYHEVHAVDGSVRILPPGQTVTATSPPARRTDLLVEDTGLGRVAWVGEFTYRCEGVAHSYFLDFNTHTKTSKRSTPLMNHVRPIPESDPQFARLDGYRNDVESGWATIKRRMSLDGRACSYDPNHFVLDTVGAAVMVNAIAWQEHGGTVEPAA